MDALKLRWTAATVALSVTYAQSASSDVPSSLRRAPKTHSCLPFVIRGALLARDSCWYLRMTACCMSARQYTGFEAGTGREYWRA